MSEATAVSARPGSRVAHTYVVSRALALIDRGHRFVAVDEGFCHALNRRTDELVGRTLATVLGEAVVLTQVTPSIDRAFQGQPSTHRLFLASVEGGLRHLTATYQPCLDAGGQVSLAAMLVHDAATGTPAERMLLQYVQRNETMYELDRAILGERPPAEVARLAVACAQQLAPTTGVCIVVVDELLAVAEEDRSQLSGSGWPQTDDHPQRRKASVGVIACSDGMPALSALRDDVIRLPLALQGDALGELLVLPRQGYPLDTEHHETLQQIAGRMSRALHHALIRDRLRRYTLQLEQALADRTQEIKRRRQAAEGLREILGFLNSNRPLGEILDHAFKQAELLLGADAVAVFSPVDTREPEVYAANCIFEHSSVPSRIAAVEAAAVAAAARRAVEARAPITVFGTPDAPHSSAAHLVVPMQVERGVSGVIVYYFDDKANLTTESIDLAVALSEQVVLATESERLQRRAEEAVLLEERERLARELHDAVTQSIYSLTLFAEAGRRQALIGQFDRVQEYLTLLGDTAQQAMKQMRLMLYELRPAVLEQVGLVGALRQRLDAVEKRAGISACLEITEPVRLPPSVEDGLYRICQEVLNNALKHASARKVVVRLKTQDDMVILEIADDGVGFVLGQVEQTDSPASGLVHIRERAARMNAELTIDTAPDHGTNFKLSLALPSDSGNAVRQGAPAAP